MLDVIWPGMKERGERSFLWVVIVFLPNGMNGSCVYHLLRCHPRCTAHCGPTCWPEPRMERHSLVQRPCLRQSHHQATGDADQVQTGHLCLPSRSGDRSLEVPPSRAGSVKRELAFLGQGLANNCWQQLGALSHAGRANCGVTCLSQKQMRKTGTCVKERFHISSAELRRRTKTGGHLCPPPSLVAVLSQGQDVSHSQDMGMGLRGIVPDAGAPGKHKSLWF